MKRIGAATLAILLLAVQVIVQSTQGQFGLLMLAAATGAVAVIIAKGISRLRGTHTSPKSIGLAIILGPTIAFLGMGPYYAGVGIGAGVAFAIIYALFHVAFKARPTSLDASSASVAVRNQQLISIAGPGKDMPSGLRHNADVTVGIPHCGAQTDMKTASTRPQQDARSTADQFLDAAERQGQPASDDNDYQKGLQIGEEMGAAIVEAVDEEFEELGKVMIGVFTTRLAVKSVLSDDPTSVSRACIAELSEQLQGDGLKEIKAAVSGRLSDWEQISREVDSHDEYERLVADRLEGLYLKLWVRAITIGAAVVTARNEELGLEVTESDLLPLGREILETAREVKVSLDGGNMEPFPREFVDYIFEVTNEPPIESVEEK